VNNLLAWDKSVLTLTIHLVVTCWLLILSIHWLLTFWLKDTCILWLCLVWPLLFTVGNFWNQLRYTIGRKSNGLIQVHKFWVMRWFFIFKIMCWFFLKGYMFGFISTWPSPLYFHFSLIIPSFPTWFIISRDHLFPAPLWSIKIRIFPLSYWHWY